LRRPVLSFPHSPGFGSAWLLLGLVFALILGALAWPKIQQAKEKAKIDTAVSIVRNYRLACLSYYSRRGTFPLDGEEGVADESGGFVRLPDGRTLDPSHTTMGDILVQQGYLEDISFPIGTQGEPVSIRALTAQALIKKVGEGPIFESAPIFTKAVILVVPHLSPEQANQLKMIFRKQKSGDRIENKSKSEPMDDCRLSFDQPQKKVDAYIYLAHE